MRERYRQPVEHTKVLARVARYREDHRQLRREQNKQWVSEHYDRFLIKCRTHNHSYRARKRGQFVEIVDPMVVYARDGGLCGICGLPVDRGNFHVDHVMPLSKGGLHSYANVQISHPHCNLVKGAR